MKTPKKPIDWTSVAGLCSTFAYLLAYFAICEAGSIVAIMWGEETAHSLVKVAILFGLMIGMLAIYTLFVRPLRKQNRQVWEVLDESMRINRTLIKAMEEDANSRRIEGDEWKDG